MRVAARNGSVGSRLRDLGAQLERAHGAEAQVGCGEPRVADVGAFVDQGRAELELVAGEPRRRARAGRRAARGAVERLVLGDDVDRVERRSRGSGSAA